MKKVIEGKRYDTETARKLGEWDNGLGYCDFSYCSETLYKKRTGEFFLLGDGGAASKYSSKIDMNTWGGETVIVPISDCYAKRWVSEKLSAEDYERIFGTRELEIDEARDMLIGAYEICKKLVSNVQEDNIIDLEFGKLGEFLTHKAAN